MAGGGVFHCRWPQPGSHCHGLGQRDPEPGRRAHDAGIPIITVDTFIDDGNYQDGAGDGDFPLSYIASDNVLGGQIAARALAEAIGARKEGRVLDPAADLYPRAVDGLRSMAAVVAVAESGKASSE